LKADPLRWDTWLSQLVEAQAQACQLTKKHIWRQLWEMEKICTTARQVNFTLGWHSFRKGLTRVIAPNIDGKEMEYTGKTSIEQACLTEAKQ